MTAPEPSVPMAPFNPTPTMQNVMLDGETLPDGTKLIKILIVQPCTTTVLYLTDEGARSLADQLFQRANGLSIAREMPGEGT